MVRDGRCRGAVQLAAGFRHTCARLASGVVYCWGSNKRGQLGDGSAARERLAPVAVAKLRDAVSIAAAGSHSCALIRGGRVRCWGGNKYGQLGDGTRARRRAPVASVGLSGVSAIAAGDGHTCALVQRPTSPASKPRARVFCWGDNGYGQLGRPASTLPRSTKPLAVAKLDDAVGIAAGTSHTCAWLRDGSARCWGANHWGNLGDGTKKHSATPVRVKGLGGVVGLSAAYYSSCARLRDGAVACWGRGDYGQLGDGLGRSRPTPARVVGLASSGVVGLSSYSSHVCARLRDGRLSCWGDNGFGQLGVGSYERHKRPALAARALGAVIAIAAGGHHVCALSPTRLACWGRNDSGQLGDGTRRWRTLPRDVSATAPLTDRAQPARATPVVDPDGYGDPCAADADCTWRPGRAGAKLAEHLGRCVAKRRAGGSAARVAGGAKTASGALARPAGACRCARGRCAFDPVKPPAPDGDCERRDCGIDEGAGVCTLGRGLAANRSAVGDGPRCYCVLVGKARRCAYRWHKPVPCKTHADCWSSSGRPTRRPKALRKRRFRVCRDGERAPLCVDGHCALGPPAGC